MLNFHLQHHRVRLVRCWTPFWNIQHFGKHIERYDNREEASDLFLSKRSSLLIGFVIILGWSVEPGHLPFEVLETFGLCGINIIGSQVVVIYDGRTCTIYGDLDNVTIEGLGWQALRWNTGRQFVGLKVSVQHSSRTSKEV